jgi:DNA-binding NarL/FixJ family response regulator
MADGWIAIGRLVKLLVVEDHTLVREGLVAALRRMKPGVHVLEAQDAESALRILMDEPEVELVLLDLVLPRMDGFAFLGLLRQRFPSLPVVVVSGITDGVAIRRVARLGAAGFVHKSCTSDELLDAARIALQGGVCFPDPETVLDAAGPGRPVRQRDLAQEAGLTMAQTRVLGLLAEGKTNREIAELLGLTEGTVKIHLSAIYRALKVSSRAQALVVIRRGHA